MATENSVMAVIRASRPTFRNPHDKVAFTVHASCVASGFVLLATGPSAFCDDPFSSASAGKSPLEQNLQFIISILAVIVVNLRAWFTVMGVLMNSKITCEKFAFYICFG